MVPSAKQPVALSLTLTVYVPAAALLSEITFPDCVKIAGGTAPAITVNV